MLNAYDFKKALENTSPELNSSQSNTNTTSPAKATTSKESSFGSFNEILNLLKSSEILPSEMAAISNNLNKLYTQNAGQLSSDQAVKIYLQTLGQINQAKQSKDLFEKSYQEAVKNNSLNDIAINNLGQIIAQDEDGELSAVSIQELQDGYRPLTNGELLNLRQNNPGMIFNDSIFNIVQGGMSYDKVTDLIQKGLRKLGTTSVSEGGVSESLETLRTAQQSILEKIDNGEIPESEMDYAMSINGLYDKKVINKSQAGQIKKAIAYMWSTLPAQAKTWLKIQSNGDDSGALELMTKLATAGESYMYANDVGFKQGRSTGKTSKAVGSVIGGGFDKEKVGDVQAWYMGIEAVNDSQVVTFNPGSIYAFSLPTYYGTIKDKASGSPLGTTTLQSVENSSFSTLLDISNATFAGERILDPRMAVINANRLYHIDLPIDMVAYQQDGIIRPDLHMAKRLEEAEDYCKQNNITDPVEKARIATEKFNLPAKYVPTANGYEISGEYRTFGVLTADIPAEAFDNADDIDRSAVDIIENEVKLKRILGTINGNSKSKVLDRDSDDYNGTLGDEPMFHGSIYIPVTGNVLHAKYGDNNKPYEINYNDYIDLEHRKNQRNQLLTDDSRPEIKHYESR